MASTSSYVPNSCTVLNVIEWLPKDDSLPGFIVLTFIGFFVIGAILALLVVRWAVREVEVKRRYENSFTGDNGKDVWVFGYKIYVRISVVLICIFLVTLSVVLIWFATRDADDRRRSEERMSDGFSSSVWIWLLVAAIVLLPLFAYLVLKCILFPGTFQALKRYCQVKK